MPIQERLIDRHPHRLRPQAALKVLRHGFQGQAPFHCEWCGKIFNDRQAADGESCPQPIVEIRLNGVPVATRRARKEVSRINLISKGYCIRNISPELAGRIGQDPQLTDIELGAHCPKHGPGANLIFYKRHTGDIDFYCWCGNKLAFKRDDKLYIREEVAL